MTLARRGRKFGLGIGISTQRIANLAWIIHEG
jgi:DNA helicase HerA-like ATPase